MNSVLYEQCTVLKHHSNLILSIGLNRFFNSSRAWNCMESLNTTKSITRTFAHIFKNIARYKIHAWNLMWCELYCICYLIALNNKLLEISFFFEFRPNVRNFTSSKEKRQWKSRDFGIFDSEWLFFHMFAMINK